MKSFNKKGDAGTTRLLFGHSVPKHSPRPEAYGVVDEANSALGLARAFLTDAKLKNIVLDIQNDLFVVGAELAALPQELEKLKARITREHALRLERLIEEYEALFEMPRAFVPPGDTPASGALDMARSIVRRAERRIAKLAADGDVRNPEILQYFNRLADLLFTLARYEEFDKSPRS
ncbi:MAG: cob(I)yrinic acid a,c-diamide adenosyltransferase [Candidatus Abyssubacteria bacterium]